VQEAVIFTKCLFLRLGPHGGTCLKERKEEGRKEGEREGKWAGDVAQAVEHLPSKCKALSSNPSTILKKKEKSNKKSDLQGGTKTVS
jgi:hypothetical protein